MSGRSRIAPYLAEDFRFDTAPSVVKWAEENLIIPASMSPAQPGPFSTRRRPMMRPILECWHPQSGVRNLTVTAGAQWGKTAIGVIGSAYRIPHSPGPELIIGPAEDWLKLEISEKRLQALINENPVLRAHKPFDSSKFRKLAMEMSGGTISIEGATSSTSTAGSTQLIVWVEEAAKIEHQNRAEAPEAHPIKLAFERTKDFRGLHLHYLSFTPNQSDHLAWTNWQSGDQTHFHVPCPHCGKYFKMEFEVRRGEKEELESVLEQSQQEAQPEYYRSLIWSPGARQANGLWDKDRIIESCRYVCPHNGCEIHDDDKLSMMEKFEEKRENPLASTEDRSFRAPSFYAPRVRFGDMAWEFLQRGDLFTTGLQNFYNSWLALPWEKVAANIKDEDVRAIRDKAEYRRSSVPRRPIGLAITADPGDRMTHWEVGAIYADGEIDIIDWGTVLNIEDLQALRKSLKYQIAGTDEYLSPAIGACDARYETIRVYKMCAGSHGFWYPTMGSDARVGTWGVTHIRHLGLDRYTYNDHALKKELYVNRIKKGKAPRFFIPIDSDEGLIQAHSGQQLLIKDGGEFFKRIPWDHWGDCSKLLLLICEVWRAARGETAPDMPADLAEAAPVDTQHG